MNYVHSIRLNRAQNCQKLFPPDEDLADGGLLHRANQLRDLSLTETDPAGSALTRIWPVLQLKIGKSLVSLSVTVDFMPVPLPADFFSGLDVLERLEWDVPAAHFTLPDLLASGEGGDETRSRDALSLPRLRELRMTATHSTFYATLARFAYAQPSCCAGLWLTSSYDIQAPSFMHLDHDVLCRKLPAVSAGSRQQDHHPRRNRSAPHSTTLRPCAERYNFAPPPEKRRAQSVATVPSLLQLTSSRMRSSAVCPPAARLSTTNHSTMGVVRNVFHSIRKSYY